MNENEISYACIGAAIAIHKEIGPGLFESVYEHALVIELEAKGLKVQRQITFPFEYKGYKTELGFRIDLLVNDKVIIEVKAVEQLASVHFSQVLTYLKLTDKRLGLLINFNSRILKNNIKRIVNNL